MCHQHLQLHRVEINNFGKIVANQGWTGASDPKTSNSAHLTNRRNRDQPICSHLRTKAGAQWQKKPKGYGRRRKELNRIQDQMNHSHLAEASPPLQCEWYSSGLD